MQLSGALFYSSAISGSLESVSRSPHGAEVELRPDRCQMKMDERPVKREPADIYIAAVGLCSRRYTSRRECHMLLS